MVQILFRAPLTLDVSLFLMSHVDAYIAVRIVLCNHTMISVTVHVYKSKPYLAFRWSKGSLARA